MWFLQFLGTGACKGKKRKAGKDKGGKRNKSVFLTCDDNALEELFAPSSANVDSDSSSSRSSDPSTQFIRISSRSSSCSGNDKEERRSILANCQKAGQNLTIIDGLKRK